MLISYTTTYFHTHLGVYYTKIRASSLKKQKILTYRIIEKKYRKRQDYYQLI